MLLPFSAFRGRNEQARDPVCSVKRSGQATNGGLGGEKTDEGRNFRGPGSPFVEHHEGE